jgi:hypothetical protein
MPSPHPRRRPWSKRPIGIGGDGIAGTDGTGGTGGTIGAPTAIIIGTGGTGGTGGIIGARGVVVGIGEQPMQISCVVPKGQGNQKLGDAWLGSIIGLTGGSLIPAALAGPAATTTVRKASSSCSTSVNATLPLSNILFTHHAIVDLPL